MADVDTMDFDDDTVSRKKEPETPLSEEFSRIDALVVSDPEAGIRSLQEIGFGFYSLSYVS
jgi:hypothetical protein